MLRDDKLNIASCKQKKSKGQFTESGTQNKVGQFIVKKACQELAVLKKGSNFKIPHK